MALRFWNPGLRTGIRYTFAASETSSSRSLRQTPIVIAVQFVSMKTKKLTEVLKRIEAWPPEAQDELADIALELDAGLSDGDYEPTPEELAGIERGLRASAEGRFATPHQVNAAFAKFMTVSATSARFEEHTMWVDLTDGRTLGIPLAWFPRLLHASPVQREQVEVSRTGLHWEGINEDISIAGLLAGRPDDALSPLRQIAAIGERQYDSIKEMMERDHFGAYVMINTDTSDYVVAPTISQVYAAFTERFGADAPGWSTPIGISIFASARP